MRLRIKPGTRVYQDFRFFDWPPHLSEIRFYCESERAGHLLCRSYGFGVLDAGDAGYGKGPVLVLPRGGGKMSLIDDDVVYLVRNSGLSLEDKKHLLLLILMKRDLFFIAIPSEGHERHIAKALGISDQHAAAVKRRLLKAGVIDLDWRPNIGREGGE